MDIQAALRSGKVRRYHAQPDIPAQSTAEHMWGVAMLVMMFYPTASVTLLKAALSHDCGEVGLGDMPSPTKQAAPGMREILKDMEHDNMSSLGLEPWEEHLSPTEKTALKICDVLEGLQYTARHVHATGYGEDTLRNWINLALKLPLNSQQYTFLQACVNKPAVNLPAL
ncbi:HD domain-containing protein [Aeromonas phage pAh6.2TG]|uniref:HD domain-containing protein n=1 Tax=Aeromonas phage pAh6.2TG TaxID=2849625 RepID=A0A8F3HN53_9CAUD|nr:HD domain-containing protein [Aeromonas phage pAh6.2TG]QWY14079.1 HD domain-containing protein [Aeromonas phage pAh6.2TG]